MLAALPQGLQGTWSFSTGLDCMLSAIAKFLCSSNNVAYRNGKDREVQAAVTAVVQRVRNTKCAEDDSAFCKRHGGNAVMISLCNQQPVVSTRSILLYFVSQGCVTFHNASFRQSVRQRRPMCQVPFPPAASHKAPFMQLHKHFVHKCTL